MERFKRFIKIKDVKTANAPMGGDHGQTSNTPEKRLAKFKRYLMPCLQGDKPASSKAQQTPGPGTSQVLGTDIQGQGPSRSDAPRLTPKPATPQALQGQDYPQSTPETGIESNKRDSIGSTDRSKGLSETRPGEQSEREKELADLKEELADYEKDLEALEALEAPEALEEKEKQKFDDIIKEQGKYGENLEEQKRNLDEIYVEKREKHIQQVRDLFKHLSHIYYIRVFLDQRSKDINIVIKDNNQNLSGKEIEGYSNVLSTIAPMLPRVDQLGEIYEVGMRKFHERIEEFNRQLSEDHPNHYQSLLRTNFDMHIRILQERLHYFPGQVTEFTEHEATLKESQRALNTYLELQGNPGEYEKELAASEEKTSDLHEDLRKVEGWIVRLRNGESLGPLQLNRKYVFRLDNDEKELNSLRLEIQHALRSEWLTPADHVKIQLDKLLASNNKLTSNDTMEEITKAAINKMEEIPKAAIATVSHHLVTDLQESIPPDKYSPDYVMERVASLPDVYIGSTLSDGCVVTGVRRGLQLLGIDITGKDFGKKTADMLGYSPGKGAHASNIPTVYQHHGFDYRHAKELVTIDEIQRATERGYPVHIGLRSGVNKIAHSIVIENTVKIGDNDLNCDIFDPEGQKRRTILYSQLYKSLCGYDCTLPTEDQLEKLSPTKSPPA